MPRNFSFVVPGRLAGMGLPGWGEGLTDDLIDLANAGVRAVVSLTEEPLEAERLARAGFDYLHVPVVDYSPPAPAQIDACVAFYRDQAARGRAVAFHCFAGVGRTGTMLACVLVAEGMAAADAVRAVREARPGSIETAEQERAVARYAARLAEASSGGAGAGAGRGVGRPPPKRKKR